MFIEDLIYHLHISCKLNRYDSPIVSSFVNQIAIGNGFTEKQNFLALKILKRYSSSLSSHLQVDILGFIDNPIYKLPIRKVNKLKKISIIDHKIFSRAIKLEFPFDSEKIDQIRKVRNSLKSANWDNDLKSWIFALDESTICFLSSFIDNENFDIDEEFKNYLEQLEEITNSIENYVPMLGLVDNLPKFLNVSPYTPQIVSKEILPAIFEARKVGIFTWTDEINQYLDKINLDPVLRTFLSNENPNFLEINSEEYPIDCLYDIIQYTQPTLFIIPGGSELEKTSKVYEFLKKYNFKSDDISVMFRLPNKTHKNFNDFVKQQGLNNSISSRTKFVFVSTKMPKPILDSKIKFNSVISLGRSNVHYSIQEFFKNRQNLIYYCESNKQKEINFEGL